MAKPATKTSTNVPANVRPVKGGIVLADLNTVPEHMRSDVGTGLEKVRSEDLEIPRIKLIQGVSKELEVYDDLRTGDFWHSAAEHSFGDHFRAVPVLYELRYLLWNPLEAGGGILARSDDGIHWSPPDTEFIVKLDRKDGGDTVKWKTADTVVRSGLHLWGSMNPGRKDSPPAATMMHTFLLAFPDHPDMMPAVFTFQRTGIKYGKRLLTKLKTSRNPMFGLVFEFKSKQVPGRGKDQNFYVAEAFGVGRLGDDPASVRLYDEYKALNENFTAKGLNIRDEGSLQTEPAGDDEPDDEPVNDPKSKVDAKGRRRI